MHPGQPAVAYRGSRGSGRTTPSRTGFRLARCKVRLIASEHIPHFQRRTVSAGVDSPQAEAGREATGPGDIRACEGVTDSRAAAPRPGGPGLSRSPSDARPTAQGRIATGSGTLRAQRLDPAAGRGRARGRLAQCRTHTSGPGATASFEGPEVGAWRPAAADAHRRDENSAGRSRRQEPQVLAQRDQRTSRPPAPPLDPEDRVESCLANGNPQLASLRSLTTRSRQPATGGQQANEKLKGFADNFSED